MPETTSSLAVLRTGGRQYVVFPGQKLEVDRLPDLAGSVLELGDVLLLHSGEDIQFAPKGALRARIRVLAHGQDRKIDVFRYKAKKHSRVRKGHRRQTTAIEILDLVASPPANAPDEREGPVAVAEISPEELPQGPAARRRRPAAPRPKPEERESE